MTTLHTDRMRRRAQDVQDAEAARHAARQREQFLTTPLGQLCQSLHDGLAAFGARLAVPKATE